MDSRMTRRRSSWPLPVFILAGLPGVWPADPAHSAEESLWTQPSLIGAPSGLKQSLQDIGIDLSVTYTAFE